MDGSLIIFVFTVFSSLSLSIGSRVIVEEVTTCDGKPSKLVDISGLEIIHSKSNGWGVIGNVTILRDLSPKILITGTVYKSLISWIPLVPIAPTPICEFAIGDNFVWKIIRDRSTLPKKCPFVQGVYNFEDKKVTEKDLPWFIPRGCFRIDMKLQFKKKTIACFKITGNVAKGKVPDSKYCVS